MKKTWENATVEELTIAETAMTASTGVKVDGGQWNNETGEVTYTYNSASKELKTNYGNE